METKACGGCGLGDLPEEQDETSSETTLISESILSWVAQHSAVTHTLFYHLVFNYKMYNGEASTFL